MKLELFYPIRPYNVIQRFGENHLPLYQKLGLLGHNGEDSPCQYATIVRAAHNGKVVFAGEDGSGGWGIVIRTNEKREYKDTEVYFKTIYWHLIPQIPVKVGQNVNVGDVIGYADSTGYSTGNHLHFGLKPVAQGEVDWQWGNVEQQNGYHGAVNPRPYFTGLYAADYATWQTQLKEIADKVAKLALVILRLKK